VALILRGGGSETAGFEITVTGVSVFAGGEKMKLEVTWKENVFEQGNLSEFTLQGVGADDAGDVINLQFGNVEPLEDIHLLVIAEDADVENGGFVGNNEGTWTYYGTVWENQFFSLINLVVRKTGITTDGNSFNRADINQ